MLLLIVAICLSAFYFRFGALGAHLLLWRFYVSGIENLGLLSISKKMNN